MVRAAWHERFGLSVLVNVSVRVQNTTVIVEILQCAYELLIVVKRKDDVQCGCKVRLSSGSIVAIWHCKKLHGDCFSIDIELRP